MTARRVTSCGVTLLLAIGLVVGSASCGDEDLLGDDGGAGDVGVGDTGATADQSGGTDAATEVVYRFVRIQDDDTAPTGEDPGADIDAVGLVKTGEPQYASLVAACEVGPSGGVCTNEEGVLGAPEAFPGLADDNLDECDATSANFVSLGGTGGSVVVEMPADIESGDTLLIYEVGNCAVVGAGNQARAEPITVSIGESESGPWEALTLSGDAPLYTAVVP